MKPANLLLIIGILFQVPALAQDNDPLTRDNPNDSLIGTRIWKVPPLPVVNGKIVYSGIMVPGAGHKKEQLFDKAHEYFKYNMKSDDVSIKIADKAAGHLAGTGKITYNQSVVNNNKPQAIYFDYDITIKNGQYQYRISNIKGAAPEKIDYSAMYQEEQQLADATGKWDHKYRYEILSDMDSFIILLIKGLNGRMAE